MASAKQASHHIPSSTKPETSRKLPRPKQLCSKANNHGVFQTAKNWQAQKVSPRFDGFDHCGIARDNQQLSEIRIDEAT
ncbi:MAG TPA: hypothetical protein VK579_14085, partial [Terriglobales bacterium]|nr:hypothetical protein [Terriglobales bacterium]